MVSVPVVVVGGKWGLVPFVVVLALFRCVVSPSRRGAILCASVFRFHLVVGVRIFDICVFWPVLFVVVLLVGPVGWGICLY